MIKYIIIACGCVAIYGIATGQDLNELFKQVSEQVIPTAEAMIKGIWAFITDALKK